MCKSDRLSIKYQQTTIAPALDQPDLVVKKVSE